MMGLSSTELLAMLGQLGWPEGRVGGRVVTGEAAWKSIFCAAQPPVPTERAAIVRQFARRLLVQTDVGRQRLREWLVSQSGKPITPQSVTAREAHLAKTLMFYGDDAVMMLVVDVLAHVPRPVADYAVSACMFIAVGRISAGWTTGLLPPDRRPIVISGHQDDEAIRHTIRHEAAHCWLLDIPGPAPTEREFAAVWNRAHTEGWAVLARFQRRELEDQADWLAASWGSAGVE